MAVYSQPTYLKVSETAPSCPEGTYQCGSALGVGYAADHLYKCVNGVWVDQGAYIDCGYVPPPTTCTEGDLRCGSALGTAYTPDHSYKCVSGVWTDQGYSAECEAALMACEWWDLPCYLQQSFPGMTYEQGVLVLAAGTLFVLGLALSI